MFHSSTSTSVWLGGGQWIQYSFVLTNWYFFRVRTESWILKKVLKFAKQFSRAGKMVKSLEFFFSKLQQVLSKWVFSRTQTHSISPVAKTFNHRMKSFVTLIFPHCTAVTDVCNACGRKVGSSFFKVSIDPLFGNLKSGKINYCFGKSLEKVLNFGSKNLYEPCFCTVQRICGLPHQAHL